MNGGCDGKIPNGLPIGADRTISDSSIARRLPDYGRPRPTCGTCEFPERRGRWLVIPRDPALFLSADSVILGWRRELGEAVGCFQSPSCISGAPSPQQTRWHLAMDDAEINDWLIEDIIDLLNDALGG